MNQPELGFSDCDMFGSDCDMNSNNLCKKLQEKVEYLENENDMLKNQIETSLALMNQIDQINQELTNTKNENRNLKASNDELNHRLEVTIKCKKELTDKLNQEKKNDQLLRNESYEKSKNELDSIKNSYQTQIRELTENNTLLMSKLEEKDIEFKVISNKVEKSLQNISRFFKLSFMSLDDFNDYLSNNQYVINEENHERKQDKESNGEVIANLKKNVSRIKRENKRLQKQNMHLNDTIAHNEIELENAHKEMIQTLNEKELHYKNLASNLNEEYENAKTQLENELIKYKTELKSIQKELKSLKLNTNSPPQVIVQKVFDEKKLLEQKMEFENEIENMNSQINMQKNLLKVSETKREELITNNNEHKQQINDLKSQLEHLNHQVNAMKSVHDQLIVENEALKHSMNKRIEPIPIKSIDIEKIYKMEIGQLRNQIDNISIDNTKLSNELRQKDLELDAKKRINNDLQEQCDFLTEKLKQVQYDLDDAKKELQIKIIDSNDDGIASDIWRTNIFGTQIGDKIDYIATMPSLQNGSKLNAIYSAIKESFDKEYKQYSNHIDSLSFELNSLRSIMSNFIINVTVNIFDQSITLDNFLNSESSDYIISQIVSLRRISDECHHKYNEMKDIIGYMLEMLKIENSDDINIITQSFNQYCENAEAQTLKLKKLKRKYYNLIHLYEKQNSEMKDNSELFQTRINELSQSHNSLIMDNQELEKELHSKKTQIHDLTKEIQILNTRLETLNSSHEREIDQRVKEMKCHNDTNTNQLVQEIEKFKQIIDVKDKAIEDLRKEIKQKDNIVINLSEENERMSSELLESQNNIKRQYENMIDQHKKDQKHIETVFNDAKESLQKQCQDQLDQIIRLNEENQDQAKLIASLKNAYSKAQSEKRKADSNAKLSQESLSMGKRLIEAQSKQKILETERMWNSKVEELKSKHQGEKLYMISLTADKFKKFFNPSEPFNERTFKHAINSINEDYYRLYNSDNAIRRMLCVNENQTTEDAVAHLLI